MVNQTLVQLLQKSVDIEIDTPLILSKIRAENHVSRKTLSFIMQHIADDEWNDVIFESIKHVDKIILIQTIKLAK